MQPTDDFSTLRLRLIERLTESSFSAEKTVATLHTLRDDGIWPDIDLLDRDHGSWELSVHLERMRELAILFRSSEGDPKVAEVVTRALAAWVRQDPTSDNWWYNHVCSPKEIGIVLLLMSDCFSPDDIPGSLDIVYRARIEIGRIWECLIRLTGAALTGNEEEAEVALSAIWSGIALETSLHGGEGIQHDQSYHFHGRQLYSGGYGRAHVLLARGIFAAGTAISGPEGEFLQTGVNQCWQAGEVWVKDVAGIRQVGEDGARGTIEWVWHDGTGYVFVEGQEVVVGCRSQEGEWSHIMDLSDAFEYQDTLPRDVLDRPVFSVWIEHGTSVRDGWYQYSIFPGMERESMSSVIAGGCLAVLENTFDAQVFRDQATGLIHAAFYIPGSAAGVTVDRPCLAIIRQGPDWS